MLFVGAIPKDTAAQTFRQLDMALVDDAYICCSGSFRFEQAISVNYPHITCHSNDVSLLTSALGSLAAGKPTDFTFTGDLDFIEGALAQIASDRGEPIKPVERCAGLLVATRMCHFRGDNDYMRSHIEHYRSNAQGYLIKAAHKLEPYIEKLNVGSFYVGDFRDHAERAIEHGGTVFAWPPLFKGDYERFYRLIHNNVTWQEPTYNMWNPAELPAWIQRLDDSGVRYVVCSDQDFSAEHGIKPVALFFGGRNKKIYLYSSNRQHSSYVRINKNMRREAMGYEPIDTDRITKDSRVQIHPCSHAQLNYIKDKYQAIGLHHYKGDAHYLVTIDGMLAGGFAYVRPKTRHTNAPTWQKYPELIERQRRIAHHGIYLLSDFACARGKKLSKLIAMLATGREPIRQWEIKYVKRIKVLLTTARTPRPVSMKYRGVFKLQNRNPQADNGDHVLNYISGVREASSQEIFNDWWTRYADPQPKTQKPGRARGRRSRT